MASTDHLHQESLTLRVKDHSDVLFVQYLVNCLDEDHVSHGITIQEPRPRPMKETLHCRHHSTVLPKFGSNRMESHQNLHTHAVDSAIQLQGNNRVLKKRHPQYRTRNRDSTEYNDALFAIWISYVCLSYAGFTPLNSISYTSGPFLLFRTNRRLKSLYVVRTPI